MHNDYPCFLGGRNAFTHTYFFRASLGYRRKSSIDAIITDTLCFDSPFDSNEEENNDTIDFIQGQSNSATSYLSKAGIEGLDRPTIHLSFCSI